MVLILYIAFTFFSFLIVVRKGRLALCYLPIVLVLLEITNIGLSVNEENTGMNGLYLIILLIFLGSCFKLSQNKIYNRLLLPLLLLALMMLFNVSEDLSVINSVSRIGNFLLVLAIIPVTYLNRYYFSRKLFLDNLMKATVIYLVYIVIASLLKFGPNHYNTGLVYGFKFEQWYFGAISVVLLPVFLKYRNSKVRDIIVISVLGILLLLVLRRTVWLIIFGGFFLVFLQAGSMRKYLKYAVPVMVIGVPFFWFMSSLSLWEARGSKAEISADNIEEESRYLELENSLEILDRNNKLWTGSNYLFDEVGRYEHKNPNRSMHGTYSRIIFGTGLLGFIFYFSFLILSLRYLWMYREKGDLFTKTVISLFALYFAVVATGASGIGLGVSYVATLFLMVGMTIDSYERKHIK